MCDLVKQCTPEEMSKNNLAGCSPFLKPETLVPLKHAIVHMGSGQHGQVLGFTKCRHDLPDNLSLLHRGLGTDETGGGHWHGGSIGIGGGGALLSCTPK